MSQFYEYDFQGRCPSKAQIMAKINAGLKTSPELVTINWGENYIQLIRIYDGSLTGRGWIRRIGGDDIAQELNRAQALEAALKAKIRAQGCSVDFMDKHLIIKAFTL